MTIKNIESIAVIGAGHLGHPLATSLSEAGHQVIGTNTSKINVNTQYKNIIFSLNQITQSEQLFSHIDIFIINIPPSKTTVSDLLTFKRHFKNKHFIFVSSVGVFSKEQILVDEMTIPAPITERSKLVYEQEQVFSDDCIIRCSGLVSKTRHPVHSLLRRNVKIENHHLNLIHIDDVIGIIKETIKRGIFHSIIHATHINSLLKKNYYQKFSKKYSFGDLEFIESTEKGTKVLSNTLLNWNYKFKDDLF